MLTGGMTYSPHRGPLQARQVTMTWFQKHFGELEVVRLKSPAATIALILLSFVRILTVSLETLSEDFCPVMVNSVIVTFGPTINALEAVRCIMEARIVLQRASENHTVVAIFRAAAALVSGASGVLVMVRWWCLEEEEVDVTEQITVSGSPGMTMEGLKNGLIQERVILETTPLTPLHLTPWICGFVKIKNTARCFLFYIDQMYQPVWKSESQAML